MSNEPEELLNAVGDLNDDELEKLATQRFNERTDFREKLLEKLKPLRDAGVISAAQYREAEKLTEQQAREMARENVKKLGGVRKAVELGQYYVSGLKMVENKKFDEHLADHLIDQINSLDYEIYQTSSSAVTSSTSIRGQEGLLNALKAQLAEAQGGRIDRFKLRGKSRAELEHLMQETESEIAEMEQDVSKSEAAWRGSLLPAVLDLFNPRSKPAPHKYMLFLKKRLLSDIKLRLREPELPSSEERARRVAANVRQMNEEITILERACEEEVKKYPDRADAIRRRYRKQIDAILEAS